VQHISQGSAMECHKVMQRSAQRAGLTIAQATDTLPGSGEIAVHVRTVALPSTTSAATRGRTLLKTVMILLGSLIAIASYRYLFGSVAVPETISANRYFDGWVLVHAASAATALLIGPLQFIARLRQSRPNVHRSIGAGYVIACLAGGLSALPLAIGTVAGPLAGAGFIALGTAWMTTVVIAVKCIKAGKIAAHRRWMVRSFGLTLAAVTLRLYLFVSGMLRIDFFLAYPVIAWACWLPNMLAVEWYLRSSSLRHVTPSYDGTPGRSGQPADGQFR